MLNALFLKYGHTTTSIIRNFEKTKCRLNKANNHNHFLKSCLEADIVPNGLLLKPKLGSAQEQKILHNTEKQLIKCQISNLHRDINLLNSLDVDNHIQLYSRTTSIDFKTIVETVNTSCNKKYAQHQATLQRKLNNLIEKKFVNRETTTRITNDPGSSLSRLKVINISNKEIDSKTTDLLNKGEGFGIDRSYHHRLDNLVRLNAYTKNKNEKATKAAVSFDKFMRSSINRGHNQDDTIIRNIKKDKDITLTRSDKGNRLVILDSLDYNNKLNNYIVQNFKEIDRDPTNKLQADLRSFLKKELKWDQKTILKISPTYPKKPSIYGLPKVHKEGNPLRIIINQKNTVYSNISKLLASGLFKILQRPQSHIRNGKDFANAASKVLLDVSKHNLLTSIDIKEMYPSIPPRAALRCLNLKLNQVPDPIFRETLNMEKNQAMFLIQSILSTSYFSHGDSYYSQDKGLAMGSALSPLLADIYMEELESKILKRYSQNISLWRRYVDDTFLIWHGSITSFEAFMEDINCWDPHIKFTWEYEKDGSLPFLDLRVTRLSTSLTTSFYHKPTSGLSLMHFNSNHPLKLKINVAIQKLYKIQDYCSNNMDRIQHKRTLTQDLRILGYPTRVINRIFNSLKTRTQQHHAIDNKPKESFLPLFYDKVIQKDVQEIFQPSVIAWKQNNNILDAYKAPGRFSKFLDNKNAIYVIPCSCSNIYIGETGRPVSIRKKEHEHNVDVKDPNSHIVTHLKDNPTHSIKWASTIIIDTETDPILRKLKEASFIHINKHICISRPTIDIDHCWKWILDKYAYQKTILGVSLQVF